MASESVTKAQEAIQGGRLLDLVAAGQSVAAAARGIGMNERTAQRLFHAELQRYFKENATQREELVGRELRTLDLLQRKVMRMALDGDLKAVDRVLSIMKMRADMLGLNAAAKVSVEVSRVDEALADIVKIIDGSIVAAAELEYVTLPEAG